MVAINYQVRNRREMFVAELAEAALGVVSQQGMGGSSVELEIDLWNHLDRALDRLSGDLEASWEHRVAVLVRAAYAAALGHGMTGSFVELELGLWQRFRGIVRQYRFLPRGTSRGERLPRLSQFLAIR